jgi:hypothetical protein
MEKEQMEQDYEFVLKKFNLTEAEFEAIIKAPRREHTEFATIQAIYSKYPLLNVVKPFVLGLRKMGVKI